MQKQLLAGLLAAFLLALTSAASDAAPIISHHVYGPSPWQPFDQFQEWLKTNLKDKPFYVVTVEGRLHHGVSEWRVRWTPSPKHVEWYWYWWFGSTGPEYEAEASPLVGKKGFDQIWLQSFVDAEGVRKYQAIYLKIIWPKNMRPPSTSYESPRAAPPALAPTLVPTQPAPAPTDPDLSHPEFD